MRTEVYILKPIKYPRHMKGEWSEQPMALPIISFWNKLFPAVYLRHNPDLTSPKFMIQLPLSPFKHMVYERMRRIFNFKIGSIHVISDDSDSTIDKDYYK